MNIRQYEVRFVVILSICLHFVRVVRLVFLWKDCVLVEQKNCLSLKIFFATFNFLLCLSLKFSESWKILTPGRQLVQINWIPFFLKLAADNIAEPLSFIFNLSFNCKKIPGVWKCAHVLPLHKRREPLDVNNFKPIPKYCKFLANFFSKLVCELLKDFPETNIILSEFLYKFRKSTIQQCWKF